VKVRGIPSLEVKDIGGPQRLV